MFTSHNVLQVLKGVCGDDLHQELDLDQKAEGNFNQRG